jgi:alpha-galactosidase
MLLAFGAYPAAGDRHIAEFFPQLLREKAFNGKTLGIDAFPFEEVVSWGEGIYRSLKETAFSRQPLNEDFFRLAPEESLAVLGALRQNQPRLFSMTQPNIGQMPQMPSGAPVETPVLVCGGRLQPVVAPPLPAAIAGILATRFQWVECVVDAALANDSDLLVQALLLDGAVSSVDAAAALADEYMAHNAVFRH